MCSEYCCFSPFVHGGCPENKVKSIIRSWQQEATNTKMWQKCCCITYQPHCAGVHLSSVWASGMQIELRHTFYKCAELRIELRTEYMAWISNRLDAIIFQPISLFTGQLCRFAWLFGCNLYTPTTRNWKRKTSKTPFLSCAFFTICRCTVYIRIVYTISRLPDGMPAFHFNSVDEQLITI